MTNNPLAAITVLRKISCHPALIRCLEDEVVDAVGNTDENGRADAICGDLDKSTVGSKVWDKADLPVASNLLNACGKLKVLHSLVCKLKAEGHRVLVFSQSSRMLDIIAIVLNDANISHLRIDGSLPGPERSRVVRSFNTDAEYTVCLLTTGVGSLGLTLTSAARVIIYDLSWNPQVMHTIFSSFL